MRKEWLYQLIVLLLFYLDGIIEVDHDGIFISETPIINFFFLLYHALLFTIVNYILIPKFFNKKKYGLFLIYLISSIAVFGVLEEGVVEKLLTPNSRGLNKVTWQSVYWFFGEILVPLLAFITIKLGFDNFAKQQQLERVEKDNLVNELKFLKSQIQPHILFNSLNNLYNYTLQRSEKAPSIVLKLSNVLRYILYETTTQKVALSKEIAFVEDYINLQKMQFEGRGKITYTIEKPINFNTLTIVPFILIPFIENSFKHSFGSKIKGVVVQIQIIFSKNQLQFFVSNNFEKEKENTEELIYSGIGLENVKKRLNLLYPNNHDLKLKEFDQNFEVRLNLNLTE